MELTYTQVGDYLLPNLVMDPQPEGNVGVWGRRRKRYLKERRDGTYTAMVLKGTLTQHLIDTDEAAWVQRMNSIRNRAEEIVRHELIEV